MVLNFVEGAGVSFPGCFLEGVDIPPLRLGFQLIANGDVFDLIAVPEVGGRYDVGCEGPRHGRVTRDVLHFGDSHAFAEVGVVEALELRHSHVFVSSRLGQVVDEAIDHRSSLSGILKAVNL